MEDETMVNQQVTFNQAEAGWLAGIIDGEGSITLNVRRKHWNGWNGIGIDLQVYVVNTDAGIIEKTVNILSKVGVEPRIHERQPAPIRKPTGDGFYINNNKTCLVVQVSKMASILKVVNCIIPYLAGEKKSRAKLIKRFIERRQERQTSRSKGGATWYDNYDWATVEEFYKLSGGTLPPEVKRNLNDHTQSMQSA